MTRARPRDRRPARPQPAADLGPVPFWIDLQVKPRPGRPAEASNGGILALLSGVHRSGYVGRMSVNVGSVKLELRTERDLAVIEELFVMLVELVDVQYGEWTLYDRQDTGLIIEAQVHGPDVNLEFTGEGGAPLWNGSSLPRRATVRLRALIEAGVSALRTLLKQAGQLDSSFGADGQLAEVWGDLDELVGAVSDLPASFKARGEA